MNYENVKEKILTLNYYLMIELDRGDKEKIEALKRKIDHYITMALTIKNNNKDGKN